MPKLLQAKLLRIESNLFFFKHTPADIISIASKAKDTKKFSYKISANKSLIIEIYRRIPLNVGYLLAKLSHLDVGSMEIITLFDDIKYFKIEFTKSVNESEVLEIQRVIANAFDMSRQVDLKDIKIRREELNIDCEHSLTHAELSVYTSNQIGLLAYIMSCFEQLHINIVTAKIHSTKYKVRDTFLMEKQNNICNNVEEIYNLLTNKTFKR